MPAYAYYAAERGGGTLYGPLRDWPPERLERELRNAGRSLRVGDWLYTGNQVYEMTPWGLNEGPMDRAYDILESWKEDANWVEPDPSEPLAAKGAEGRMSGDGDFMFGGIR
jgi:hypothetical protein